jgi:hypothetical protein
MVAEEQMNCDHVAQTLEKRRPAGVMGKDPGVEHVGIADDDLCRLADFGTSLSRGVTVIGAGLEPQPESLAHRVQLCHLVLGQRLGGKQIERPRPWIGQQSVQHRQVVAHRLAAGSRGDNDHVLAAQRSLHREGLVGVQAFDPPLAQSLLEAGIEPGRVPSVASWFDRQVPPVGDPPCQLRVALDLIEYLLQTHRRDYSSHQGFPQTCADSTRFVRSWKSLRNS